MKPNYSPHLMSGLVTLALKYLETTESALYSQLDVANMNLFNQPFGIHVTSCSFFPDSQ